MQEHVVPALAPSTTEGTLADLPARNADRQPSRVGFSRKVDGAWVDVSTTTFRDEVHALAKGLVHAGVRPGDRVAVLSATRYEWTLVDFAVWAAGAVPVPVYETSSRDQIEWILSDSAAAAIFVETPEHTQQVEGLRDRLPALRQVWQIAGDDLTTLSASGASLGDEVLTQARTGLDRSSLATIIYTSGTTGRPKGCELSHGNFLDLCENALARLGPAILTDGAATLLFLPLAHVFARLVEVLGIVGEIRLGHSSDVKKILDDLAAFRPTFVLSVPRVFEKIYNSAEQKAMASGRGAIFQRAADTAVAYSRALDEGRPGLLLRAQHALFDRLVYSTLRGAMGGRLHYAISGGAPLGERLGHFFRGAGITILEGYGLTETTAPLAVNVPERVKIGTVGPPLPGVAVRIADDGELLVKGVNVFRRYRGNDDATAEAFQDGWLRTGDMGELDEDGYVRIIGRKKELLVTAGGKNVAPAVIEDRLRAHPLVSQCIVVGDGKPFIGALMTLDEEMLPGWAQNHGLGELSPEQARADASVREALQEAVDHANAAVSRAESIRRWSVLEQDFTQESGHLTPSLKVKRGVVMEDFADQVDALYQHR